MQHHSFCRNLPPFSPTNSLKRHQHFSWVCTTISVKCEAAKFLMALTYVWQFYVNFVGFLAWIAIEEQKWEHHESCISMNCEFLVRHKINDKFLWQKLSCNCSARAAIWSYVITSYSGSNRIFKIFNSKWSYDKMLIDGVRWGGTGEYLALGQEVQTSLHLVCTPWPRAKYFPVPPSYSVNKYIEVFIQRYSCQKRKVKEVLLKV